MKKLNIEERLEEDMAYLKKMDKEKHKREFSDEELKKVHIAMKEHVDATNSAEALDIVANIILAQNLDIEKFENIANDIIKDGKILGATEAVKIADSINFRLEVRRENITEENLNRTDLFNGNSFLAASLYASKSPKVINSILDKGGHFGRNDSPEGILDMLIERVTDHYKWQLEKYGENSIKNNLDNIVTLIDRGIVEKTEDLNKLHSNPELFEKYSDVMNKLFESGDKHKKIQANKEGYCASRRVKIQLEKNKRLNSEKQKSTPSQNVSENSLSRTNFKKRGGIGD